MLTASEMYGVKAEADLKSFNRIDAEHRLSKIRVKFIEDGLPEAWLYVPDDSPDNTSD